MREFIHNYEDHLNEAFDKFKKTHNKNYKDDLDYVYRKDLFRQNIRYIYAVISIVCHHIFILLSSFQK